MFLTNEYLQINVTMLPCLSWNQTFAIKLMVVPWECSTDFNYGVIFGQDTRWALDLDTSIQDNMISWGEEQIPMVPCNYWTEEQILQKKAHFVKNPKSEQVEIPSNEIFLSKTLTPVNYVQADFKQDTWNCMDLTPNQQSKLPQILCGHEALFMGTRSN